MMARIIHGEHPKQPKNQSIEWLPILGGVAAIILSVGISALLFAFAWTLLYGENEADSSCESMIEQLRSQLEQRENQRQLELEDLRTQLEEKDSHFRSEMEGMRIQHLERESQFRSELEVMRVQHEDRESKHQSELLIIQNQQEQSDVEHQSELAAINAQHQDRVVQLQSKLDELQTQLAQQYSNHEKMLDDLQNQQPNEDGIEEKYTIFRTVKFNDSSIVTGWRFKPGKFDIPYSQYCYFTEPTAGGKHRRTDIAIISENTSRSNVADKAYHSKYGKYCNWFKNLSVLPKLEGKSL